MEAIGGQKISMPTLASQELWEKTGRWQSTGPELFKLADRHGHQYCLGPTHEELVTTLFANFPPHSYKQLPVMLYQITRKFRDEQRPKFGLLRGREFEMKDLYCFDASEKEALITYNTVCDAYVKIFDQLGVKYVKVLGATGNIGGTLSHEFHYLSPIGEDQLALCERCSFTANKELLDANKELNCSCPTQDHSCLLKKSSGIEVGHAFYLGTKYSAVLNAMFMDDSTMLKPCIMTCFGLGVTRILQAGVEVLSSPSTITWPRFLAPYQVCILPQKEGHRHDEMFAIAEAVNDKLTALPNLRGEVVIDDRTHLSIGRRLQDAKKIGYPYILVVANKSLEKPALFEVHDTVSGQTAFLSEDQLIDQMSDVTTI